MCMSVFFFFFRLGKLVYSSTMAVVSGLLNTSVHRLDRTWRLLKKRNQTLQAKFDTLVAACTRLGSCCCLFVVCLLLCFPFVFFVFITFSPQ